MPNIYLGENSWRAQRGEAYCRGRGVNATTAGCILRLITQELRRGWTYDRRTGERIKMTPRLALKRARYLVNLARRHYGNEEAQKVAQLVKQFLRSARSTSLPQRADITAPRRRVGRRSLPSGFSAG